MTNFAIIGCGHIAKKHAEAIDKAEGAKLVAVCDKIPDIMEYYTSTYAATPYTDLKQLLNRDDIDVVNICTPSGTHAPIAIQVANEKKHVIVEKPIALTTEDANAIITACNINGVKLSVVHPNRFRPATMELRRAVNEGQFGKISHANATLRWNRNQEYYDQAVWRGTKDLDGGVLMNQAIHNLDLLIWLLGDIEEVSSMSATRLRDIESEDVAVGVLRFCNGALGVIEAATTIYPKNLEETISIFGETGTVKIGGITANQIEHWNIKSMNSEDSEELIRFIKKDAFGKPGHQWIIEDMIDALSHNREPIVTGEDGKKALALVLALNESSEKNRPIKLN
jgi:UDP-N-acetyl-2-amino-2-deoxyglucuronate dehydrogenase